MEVLLASIEGDRASTLPLWRLSARRFIRASHSLCDAGASRGATGPRHTGCEGCHPYGFPVPATACAMPVLPEGRPGLDTPVVKAVSPVVSPCQPQPVQCRRFQRCDRASTLRLWKKKEKKIYVFIWFLSSVYPQSMGRTIASFASVPP